MAKDDRMVDGYSYCTSKLCGYEEVSSRGLSAGRMPLKERDFPVAPSITEQTQGPMENGGETSSGPEAKLPEPPGRQLLSSSNPTVTHPREIAHRRTESIMSYGVRSYSSCWGGGRRELGMVRTLLASAQLAL